LNTNIEWINYWQTGNDGRGWAIGSQKEKKALPLGIDYLQ